MKKFFWALPVILFPYWILIAMLCLRSDVCLKSNDPYLLLYFIAALAILAVVSFVCSVSITAKSIAKKWNAQETARLNMIIKLSQIPAYIAIFVLGAIFLITIFTFAFTFFFIVYDAISIFLSGIIGVAASLRAKDEKLVSGQSFILYGIAQFIYCADVFVAIFLFVKTKPKKFSPQQPI